MVWVLLCLVILPTAAALGVISILAHGLGILIMGFLNWVAPQNLKDRVRLKKLYEQKE